MPGEPPARASNCLPPSSVGKIPIAASAPIDNTSALTPNSTCHPKILNSAVALPDKTEAFALAPIPNPSLWRKPA